jgi:hypothetical protein
MMVQAISIIQLIKAFKLNSVGLVTDALWEDIDNDSKRFNN